MKLGSLFSGIDGLALGVQLVTGARLAWHSEIDPDACAVLARHWRVPNLTEATIARLPITPAIHAGPVDSGVFFADTC